jgi:hypothetical protein
MSAYFLPPHVHFCQRGDAFVFLDLRQDDYTLVNGPAATALKELAAQRADRDLSQDLSELLNGGLLITEQNAGKVVSPTHVDLAAECLVDRESFGDVRVTLGHVVHFAAACTAAKLSLRWRKIEDTVMSVARRKERRAGNQAFDLARAQDLAAVFHKLRGFFPANYLCLFDSLALLEFLAKYRLYPTWVFGVRLEPWAAHCWVQHQQWLLNEEVEAAATYTPIMAI